MAVYNLEGVADLEERIQFAVGLARAGELSAREIETDETAKVFEAIFDAILMHLLPINRYFEEQEKQADTAIQGNTPQ